MIGHEAALSEHADHDERSRKEVAGTIFANFHDTPIMGRLPNQALFCVTGIVRRP